MNTISSCMRSSLRLGIHLVLLSLMLVVASGCPCPCPKDIPFTTRELTIRPVAIPSGTQPIPPSYVPEYAIYGYSAWQMGPGEDEGRKFDLMPNTYTGASNKAQLLSFFTLSDIHITDKESPAQVVYFGWNADYLTSGLLSQAYSPVMLSTTQVLDAAIRTINGLHRKSPFDFGISLGDMANSSQFNELRWFIDVLDGKYITPSSGAHVGANTIGYQKPYQATGLDRSIPWYVTAGNHDQYWMGTAYPTQKLRDTLIGNEVLNMVPNPFAPLASEGVGVYAGVIDGATRYGDVIYGGPTADFDTPPTVASDDKRHSITTDESTTAGFMKEFFNTTSSPVGHGFTQNNLDQDFASYSFEPKSTVPIKIIVLDDTCKSKSDTGGPAFYGNGWIDDERYAWLTNELQKGQDEGQLMILAAHIPINPQWDLFDTEPDPQFYSDSLQNDEELIATLNSYPNLILLISGHRHKNTVTPHPSPDPDHPEFGFWQVETAALRDFPQQFRTFDIRRNSDNTISILATCVDPILEEGSPAADSRDYAIGAARLFAKVALDDTSSQAFNAELVKKLTPEMQNKIANCGTPLRHHERTYDHDKTVAKPIQ